MASSWDYPSTKSPSSILALTLAVTLSVAGTMAPWLYSAAAAALALTTSPKHMTAATKDGTDKTWHAPAQWDVNNLTKALHSEGKYGFIFDSSHTPDEKYGTYNWCNMPHVRRQEYVKPSQEFELQYVELIHRHHKRTPYASNAFPVEPYKWNCDDQGLYYYGRPFEGHDAAKGYRQGFTSDVNPFVPSGWIGSCQFPQITPGGLDDSWQHGADLYGVYHDLLGFLPDKEEDYTSKIRYRVTNNVITSQVAGMVINGMWGTSEDYPLLVQAANVDSLEPQYSCPAGKELFESIQSSDNAEWQRHLDEAEDLYRTLDDISGVPTDDEGFHASFDHYFDNLSARQCHDKPLPCKLVDGVNSTTCITQELADTVYRLGNWEYSQMYRDSPSSLSASAALYGVWVAELAVHLREVVEGKREVIYYHNVAHDGSVSRLLSMLQLDKMVWPGMGAEVVFELYKKHERGSRSRGTKTVNTSTSGYHVRVLFGGQVLESSNPTLGLMDMIPVETLLEYFDSLVGSRASSVKGKCDGSVPIDG